MRFSGHVPGIESTARLLAHPCTEGYNLYDRESNILASAKAECDYHYTTIINKNAIRRQCNEYF
jgi:hypothetical protein